MADATLLARRLANLRRTIAEIQANSPGTTPAGEALPTGTSGRAAGRERTAELAARLAADLDGEVVRTDVGTVVRVEAPSRPIAIDRDVLARLPGQPPAAVPLVCLDTETTGLGSAAGTVAFLIGLGWWEGQRFRQVQLLLPDHPEERALLHMLAAHIPPDAWLVTYNGRGFDWPLLVARYRMLRQEPPPLAGHLDLLTTVRRIFKHRMADARLRTAEEMLLGFGRVDDVEGWEIPGRYLTFLRGGSAGPLALVADHNDRDVRSLARLLAHLADELGDMDRRRSAPDGDLLGLARCFRIEGRLDEAMACLDLAVERPADGARGRRGRQPDRRLTDRSDGIAAAIAQLSVVRSNRIMRDHVARERARLLRQIGRLSDARQAWRDLGARNGPLSAIAWIELAKVLEHVDRDIEGALAAVAEADRLTQRAHTIGQPVPFLEADLARRRARLEKRQATPPARRSARRSAAAALPAAGAHALTYG